MGVGLRQLTSHLFVSLSWQNVGDMCALLGMQAGVHLTADEGFPASSPLRVVMVADLRRLYRFMVTYFYATYSVCLL